MTKISITDLQRSIGNISMRLIRGETVVLTRNGKDFARLVPVAPSLPKSKKQSTTIIMNPEAPVQVFDAFGDNKPVDVIQTGQSRLTTTLSTIGRCEAPSGCRFAGELYEVQYQTDDGIQKKKVHLCPGHAKKAKDTSESVVKL